MDRKFTLTLQIDAVMAKQILESEAVCYCEEQGGLPEEILAAIKDFFPELAAEYRFCLDK